MKKFFNFKILRIIILIILLGFVVTQTDILKKIVHSSTAQAVGDLVFDWGVPPNEPLFKIFNMAPADSINKTVTVTNEAVNPRPLSIRGIKTSETGNLANKLTLTITTNGTTLFGPKNLQEFFNDSQAVNGIPLTTINPNQTTNYNFLVGFDPESGNDYQDKNLVFDIQIGMASTIPLACQNIKFKKVIYGTQKNDRIAGTNANDLIYSHEGNDTINSGNGNDCIIGGAGNDTLSGGNGNDVIFGEDGDDKLTGSNGNDKLYGGQGNDVISGNNANDLLDGETGTDNLDGGLGVNVCLNGETLKHCQK